MKRNKDSLFENEYKLDRTECYWSRNGNIKSLQIEEVCDIEIKRDSFNLNRYIHSQRNIEKKQFFHLDGAVSVYLGDRYSTRFNSRFPNETKPFKKIKLFRLDGNIDFEDWIDIISYFYKSNEMIMEYFNPQQFEEEFEERVRDFKKWKEKNP